MKILPKISYNDWYDEFDIYISKHTWGTSYGNYKSKVRYLYDLGYNPKEAVNQFIITILNKIINRK